MALVAYSDESDISDSEHYSDESGHIRTPCISNEVACELHSCVVSSSNKSCDVENEIQLSSVELSCMSDENKFSDDEFDFDAKPTTGDKGLFSSLPSVKHETVGAAVEIDDDLSDVPTAEEWAKVYQAPTMKIQNVTADPTVNAGGKTGLPSASSVAPVSQRTEELESNAASLTLGRARQVALASSALNFLLHNQNKSKRKGKLKLLVPTIEEADTTASSSSIIEDESLTVCVRPSSQPKGPSSSGSGLFSLLSKPKNFVKSKEPNRALVPHSLAKRPLKKATQQRTRVKKLNDESVANGDSDAKEDDDGSDCAGDFFSLESNDDFTVHDKLHISEGYVDVCEQKFAYSHNNTSASSKFESVPNFQQSILPNTELSIDDRPMEQISNTMDSSTHVEGEPDNDSASGIDDETWRKLTGRKRRADEDISSITMVDVCAGDALLTKEEWMNHAVSQEKPRHSFSKKRGDLPSQQQKRKHQITYLAHEAKERESDLNNQWAAGRVKKQQARAKYGF